MENFLNDDVRDQIRGIFTNMKESVEIAVFKGDDQEGAPVGSAEMVKLMEEISDLSDKLSLKLYSMADDSEKANEYGVFLAPSIVLIDSKGTSRGVRFNGIPLGHEINSFIGGILELGGAGEAVPADIKDRVDKIDKKVSIKVFVTLGCPHCPGAVQKAHKLAMENEFIEGDMIDASMFGEISDKFNVSSVPKIVINDEYELIGNQPFEAILAEIEKAVK